MRADDMLLQAWKLQLDTGLRAAEAMFEGAIRMHEAQIEAAAQAHAAAEATRRALAGARDAQALLELQAQWCSGNLQQCIDYWRTMQQSAMQANTDILKAERAAV